MLDVMLAGVAATLALIAALFVLVFTRALGRAHTVGFREGVTASLFHVGVPPQNQQRALTFRDPRGCCR